MKGYPAVIFMEHMIRYSLRRLFWLTKRMPVIERFQYFSNRQWSSYEDYQTRLDKRLSDLLTYAVENIPYYRDSKLTVLGDEDFGSPREAIKKFPILTRADVINRSNELFVECGRRSLKNSTGGSTGQPVTFMQDKVYKTDALATTYLFYTWAGRKAGDHLVKLWGAERDLVQGGYGLKQKLSDFIENRTTLNAFELSPKRICTYLQKINRLGAYSIEGYADSLYDFARFVEDHSLSVNAATSVISSAGTLYPFMREVISRVFDAKVFDRYGSREAGNMAAECEQHSGLHIFGESTFIEVVDENMEEVSVGNEGDILVTNLSNYTMPLIRYQIGDRAVKGGESCPCGRPYPLLERISGRNSSSFRTIGGGVVSPAFFIHLFGVMTNDGNIIKFQAVQESAVHVRILLVLKAGLLLEEWKHLDLAQRLIQKVMGDSCDITFDVVDDIPKTASGKYLFTISKVDDLG